MAPVVNPGGEIPAEPRPSPLAQQEEEMPDMSSRQEFLDDSEPSENSVKDVAEFSAGESEMQQYFADETAEKREAEPVENAGGAVIGQEAEQASIHIIRRSDEGENLTACQPANKAGASEIASPSESLAEPVLPAPSASTGGETFASTGKTAKVLSFPVNTGIKSKLANLPKILEVDWSRPGDKPPWPVGFYELSPKGKIKAGKRTIVGYQYLRKIPCADCSERAGRRVVKHISPTAWLSLQVKQYEQQKNLISLILRDDWRTPIDVRQCAACAARNRGQGETLVG